MNLAELVDASRVGVGWPRSSKRGASLLFSAESALDPGPKAADASAWKAAEAYGFDMSLIEANLRRTPAERIRLHARVLNLSVALRQQMKNRRAGP